MTPKQALEQQTVGVVTVIGILVAAVTATWNLVAIRADLQVLLHTVGDHDKKLDQHDKQIRDLERGR